jgi:hypothetical protein
MNKNTQEYRGYEIVKLPRRRVGAFGDTYVVLNKSGRKVAAHSSLRDAKAQVDRILEPTDASKCGCPV